jgi:hypothetical protein
MPLVTDNIRHGGLCGSILDRRTLFSGTIYWNAQIATQPLERGTFPYWRCEFLRMSSNAQSHYEVPPDGKIADCHVENAASFRFWGSNSRNSLYFPV